MKITAEEIAAIEEAGMLDQQPIKMIRTKGGFWIAVGKLRGRFNEEALAAGSHPAIVKWQLTKKYPQFQESLMKSEAFSEVSAQVEQHSHFLTEELRKSGHEVFSVQSGDDLAFHVTKQGIKVGEVYGHIQEESVVIKKISAPKEFARALAGATAEKALSCGAKKLKIEVK